MIINILKLTNFFIIRENKFINIVVELQTKIEIKYNNKRKTSIKRR